MKLYRILKRLSSGETYIEAGQLKQLELTDAQEKALLHAGAISVASTPPLAELAHFGPVRANRLASIGIVTVQDLFNADDASIAEALGVLPETVVRWKELAQNYLR